MSLQCLRSGRFEMFQPVCVSFGTMYYLMQNSLTWCAVPRVKDISTFSKSTCIYALNHAMCEFVSMFCNTQQTLLGMIIKKISDKNYKLVSGLLHLSIQLRERTLTDIFVWCAFSTVLQSRNYFIQDQTTETDLGICTIIWQIQIRM